MNLKTKGYILGGISAVTFGLIPLFSLPMIKNGLNSETILFYRFLFASVFLCLWMIVRKESFVIKVKDIGILAVLGCFYSFSALFLFWSYDYLSAGIAASILFIYPVFVTVIMVVFFKEKLSSIIVTAVVLAILGVVLLYWGDDNMNMNPVGVIVILVSALCYALYIVGVNKSGVSSMNGIKLTFYSLAVGSVVFYIKIIFDGQLQPICDWFTFYNIIGLAIIATVVSCVTMVYSVKYIGSTATSVIGALEPVTAVIIGVAVFYEPFTFNLVIGILFILISVMLIILSGNFYLKIKQLRHKLKKQLRNR